MAVVSGTVPVAGTGCYLCGERDFSCRSGGVRDDPRIRVCECGGCGLVYLSSLDHSGDGFYQESGMHGDEAVDINVWLSASEADDTRRYEYLKGRLPERKILDFGCGAGGFLMRARHKAKVAIGVELEERLQWYFNRNGLRVYPGLDDLEKSEAEFDLITLFHVMEHLADPRDILRRLALCLDDDGEMIVEVPNADDALLTLYECEAFAGFTYWSCHLFLFSNRTLPLLVEQAGLRLNYIRQVQRYPLSNHLYWLAKGRPGGHQVWDFLDSAALSASYEKELAAIGRCDTLIMSVSKPGVDVLPR